MPLLYRGFALLSVSPVTSYHSGSTAGRSYAGAGEGEGERPSSIEQDRAQDRSDCSRISDCSRNCDMRRKLKAEVRMRMRMRTRYGEK